jgi:NAD(P)-dependent dehydrogenase (short-subunit alcohol dehydrogenase family)
MGGGGPLKGTVALVTGANCGIGKETAVALAGKGATTVLACRDTAKADEAAAEIRQLTGSENVATVRVELGDLRSVAECTEEVLERFEIVDVLVNNAGGYWDVRQTTAQGFEQHFGVNYLSHYLLTRRLLEAFGGTAPSRVVSVTSFGHRAVKGMFWDDLQLERQWTVSRAYGQSKLAQILFGREIARRYGERGVVAHTAHPGVVRSNFAEDGDTHGVQRATVRAFSVFGVSPATGARTPVYLASSDEAARSNGGYWVRRRQRAPSQAARDDAAARRLWEVSEDLVNASGVPI